MRLGLLFISFVCANSVFSQDSVLHITASMFNEVSHDFGIADQPEWYYRPGNDTGWSEREIDSRNWKRLNMHQLNASMADATGRIEGWFHLRFKLDSTLFETPLSIRINTPAAIDIYVDGKFLASFGNTGIDGQEYKEYSRLSFLPTPLNLNRESDHWIAIHYVDYTSPLSLNRLKGETRWLNAIQLTKPEFTQVFITDSIQLTLYTTLWGSVCIVLSLLFWLLAFLNKEEKSLALIATSITMLALHVIFTVIPNSMLGLSFTVSTWCNYLTVLGLVSYITLMPVILANVVRIKISKTVVVVLFLSAVLMFISQLIPNPFTLIAPIVPVLCCGYYFIISWKSLRGAQMVVVSSLLVTGLFITIVVAGFSLVYFRRYTDALPALTGVYLSFPIGLFVYIAIRFRENLDSIQAHMHQVITLEEDKRLQAESQQKRLEEEVARQTNELSTSLHELRSTQSQLIQSEKMASLGELTAGIAHEIQNPLNFVNNFSEVNTELIEELEQEVNKGNFEEVKQLTKDIKENEQKINHHGKRAGDIVKGMLQHSRSSSGIKEPTNINALADEYLRLAYHGLRAKDKSFNATMKTEFDETIGNINIIPQDIGRVILNLITNAFYAVNEKFKVESSKSGSSYEPTVTVSTKKEGNKILITVKDNGNGIPEHIKEKIFQPFFTTKPTGQGTGLGLSLSYDIVKAHGGELKVETRHSESLPAEASAQAGSDFNIVLPFS